MSNDHTRECNPDPGRRQIDLPEGRDRSIWEVFAPDIVHQICQATTVGREAAPPGDAEAIAAITAPHA